MGLRSAQQEIHHFIGRMTNLQVLSPGRIPRRSDACVPCETLKHLHRQFPGPVGDSRPAKIIYCTLCHPGMPTNCNEPLTKLVDHFWSRMPIALCFYHKVKYVVLGTYTFIVRSTANFVRPRTIHNESFGRTWTKSDQHNWITCKVSNSFNACLCSGSVPKATWLLWAANVPNWTNAAWSFGGLSVLQV